MSSPIDITKAVKVLKVLRKDGHRRTIYIMICSYPGCSVMIHVRKDGIKTHSGKCMSHSHVKRPFECIYNRLYDDHRGTKVLLTYEEFLIFCKIDKCHYCREKINRIPFPVVNGVYKSTAHYLDKKEPNGPYSKSNCVVCCTHCNRLKSNLFSYKEFLKIGRTLRDIKRKRETHGE